MDLSLFPRGLVIGFAIAAPVGPIGVLCIRRSLADGRAVGLATGLGAATADALYALVAALGLTAVGQAMNDQATGIRLVGGLALCYLGFKTLRSTPAVMAEGAGGRARLASAYATTVGLTLANPATILSFAAVFAGLGASQGAGWAVLALVLGVFLGSALWWLCLSSGAGWLRRRVRPAAMRWINVASGLILVGFGLVALLTVVG